ncbi:MerR family transcriptional regulator [Nonomuraea sp. NPDC050547]|uniref:MerR family transcriptional regulator n=1 Tax=Nonomuraea sp. NPDC050547 TaxID=3364368 RepID=UPI0037907747
MLTIGQLAAHAGVTVRAVRHYHHLGLLPEPERDASGYRRYGAAAVVDLIRIKTLADAGVPLARIDELLHASPGHFAEAVTEIDDSLAEKMDQLREHRRRISELAAGDRLFLPGDVVRILDRERALGVGEALVRVERDVWIMLTAQTPQAVPEWVAVKSAALDDPAFVELYRTISHALDWPPTDPRLPGLAEQITTWHHRNLDRPGPGSTVPADLMFSHVLQSSPALRRLLAPHPADPSWPGPGDGLEENAPR